MGLRFRKGIRVGKYFKINLSKSGIGYGFGVKGAHISRTPKGRTRRTLSIPGTGLSYVRESGKSRKKSSRKNNSQNLNVNENANENIEGSATPAEYSFNELPTAEKSDIARAITRKRLIYYIFLGILIALGAAFIIVMFYQAIPASFALAFALLIFGIITIIFRFRGKIVLDYSNNGEDPYENEKQKLFLKISKSKKIWLIMSGGEISDSKTNFSAGVHITRVECNISRRPAFPVSVNCDCACFKSKGTQKTKHRTTLMFLPDQVIVFIDFKVNSYDYDDIKIETGNMEFIESEQVPSDAMVLRHTWQKVNANGTRDKRYKDNKQLPVCRYGAIELSNAAGLEVAILISDHKLLESEEAETES